MIHTFRELAEELAEMYRGETSAKPQKIKVNDKVRYINKNGSKDKIGIVSQVQGRIIDINPIIGNNIAEYVDTVAFGQILSIIKGK